MDESERIYIPPPRVPMYGRPKAGDDTPSVKRLSIALILFIAALVAMAFSLPK